MSYEICHHSCHLSREPPYIELAGMMASMTEKRSSSSSSGRQQCKRRTREEQLRIAVYRCAHKCKGSANAQTPLALAAISLGEEQLHNAFLQKIK